MLRVAKEILKKHCGQVLIIRLPKTIQNNSINLSKVYELYLDKINYQSPYLILNEFILALLKIMADLAYL